MSDLTFDVERAIDNYEEEVFDLKDMYNEMQEEKARREGRCNCEPHTSLWTMNNGKQIRVCDMTDRHLANTINFISRALGDLDMQSTMF